jgi:hypothetical protein
MSKRGSKIITERITVGGYSVEMPLIALNSLVSFG